MLVILKTKYLCRMILNIYIYTLRWCCWISKHRCCPSPPKCSPSLISHSHPYNITLNLDFINVVLVHGTCRGFSPRLGFAEYQRQKVPGAVQGTTGALGDVRWACTAPCWPTTWTFPWLSYLRRKAGQIWLLLRWPTQCWNSAASITLSSEIPAFPSCAADPQPHLHLCFSAA